LNYHIIYRYATINNACFNSKDDCLLKVNHANKQLYYLSKNLGWRKLKQLEHQDDILKSVEYKNENNFKLLRLYEEIFEEYIHYSSSFFPENYKKEILELYGL